MNNFKAQGGFTLLEVLIAAIVMAIGLIGIAALQVTSAKYAESATQRGQAATLAQELVERVRLNLGEARDGNYDFTSLPDPEGGPDCETSACDPANMRAYDLAVWSGRLQATLPNPAASIVTTAPASALDPATITISIGWDNSRGRQVSANCIGAKPACDSYTYSLMGIELSESL